MKTFWNNFKVAFAMYSKIPMPQADWTKENMKYSMCFFPVIGAVIGLLIYGWYCLACYCGFSNAFTAAGILFINMLVTGGIHIDGFLDTSDALSSWRERGKRLEILKDSHVGAFAVICACTYFLVQFGSVSQLVINKECVMVLSFAFFLSRCLSGINVVTFPKAKKDGTVAEFAKKAEDGTVRGVLIVLFAIASVIISLLFPIKGTAVWIAALLVMAYYHHMAMKYFGGVTGDLSGWFLSICEAVIMVVLAVLSVLPY